MTNRGAMLFVIIVCGTDELYLTSHVASPYCNEYNKSVRLGLSDTVLIPCIRLLPG